MDKKQGAQKKVKSEAEDLKQKAQEYLNGWKRAQADFINYKREEAKRVQDIVKFANESLLLEAIEVLDNLEKALAHAPKAAEKEYSDWLKGIEHTYRQFRDFLSRHNVERIKVKGVDFDPLLHEAVKGVGAEHAAQKSGAESGNRKRGEMKEVSAGYKMHGKVIRPARVVIDG